MFWRYIEKKIKKSFYPDLYYWSIYVPKKIRKNIYIKYGLNIKFDYIPEYWPPFLYFCFFGRLKNYHYPTDDDIKFFYFTLFKKNGFLFLIICCIIFKNCFLDLLILLIKSGIIFYIIIWIIYLILFIRKYIYLYLKFNMSTKFILIIIVCNYYLNLIFNLKNKNIKWYF